MAEIEFLLPTVQYGNVKVRATPEELGLSEVDAGALGVAYAVFLNLFKQGFQKGSQVDVDWQGSDVSALPRDLLEQASEALKDALGATETASIEAAPGDPQAAADRLADGRPPRTVDEANAMARAVIEQELGSTTEVESGEAAYDAAYSAPNDGPEPAPWESTVDAKPKPWETGGTAPTNAVKVAEVNW